jgi:hypothetical protein
MRTLILFMHMSLDGYVKAPGKDKTGKDQTVSSPGRGSGGSRRQSSPISFATPTRPCSAVLWQTSYSGTG